MDISVATVNFLFKGDLFVHVLLVEDDKLVADGIVAGLRLHGFIVDHVETANLARTALATSQFEICILDLGLPDDDGVNLLKSWRVNGMELPVLVLTARDAVEHRVRGFQAGADDYLLKPFDLSELVARLHALLRRVSGRAADQVEHGELTFMASTGVVKLYGEPVELARRELAVLRILFQHPQQIISVEQLHDGIYGFEKDVDSNAINVHIHHLRRKLGVGVIETVRGLGYKLGKKIERKSS